MKTTLSVRVTQDVKDEIGSRAKRFGMKHGDCVREILELGLAAAKQFGPRFGDHEHKPIENKRAGAANTGQNQKSERKSNNLAISA